MNTIHTSIESTTWHIDPVHSKIVFSVTHMVISEIIGNFKKFEGKVITENENFETAKLELTIDANSIDTNNEQRDTHLRSAEFIDASKYSKIIFRSTSVKKVNENLYLITGDFTLRGVTRQLELKAKYNGSIKDPYNNKRAGFKISTEINRKDFGVNWHAALDSGGLIAGDIVEITAYIEILHH
jgi:polyisoprenoid-binding protein YceI